MSKYLFKLISDGETIFEEKDKDIIDISEVWKKIRVISVGFGPEKAKPNQTHIRVYDDEGYILISVGIKAAACLTH